MADPTKGTRPKTALPPAGPQRPGSSAPTTRGSIQPGEALGKPGARASMVIQPGASSSGIRGSSGNNRGQRQPTAIPGQPAPNTTQIGEMIIGVVKASNLRGPKLKQFADTIVMIRYGDISKTTSIQKNTLNPAWDATFTVPIFTPFAEFAITVIDIDLCQTVLGTVEIPIIQFGHQQQTEPDTFNLSLPEDDDPNLGTITLSFKLTVKPEWASAYTGARAFLEKNFIVAKRLLDEAASKEELVPFRYEFLIMKAFLYLTDLQFQESLICVQQAVEIRPKDPQGLYTMGRIYLKQNDLVAAGKCFESGLLLDPNHKGLQIVSKFVEKNLQKKKVLTIMEDAVKQFNTGTLQDCLKLIDSAASLNPGNPVYYMYRAVVHLAAQNWQEVINDYMEVARIEPSFVKNDATFKGELQKKGEFNPAYKTRWFFLKDHFYMYYFKNSVDQVPQGIMLLFRAQCNVKGKELIIRTVQRDFRLKANTNEEAAELGRIITEEAHKLKPLKIVRRIEREGLQETKVEQKKVRERVYEKVQAKVRGVDKILLDDEVDIAGEIQVMGPKYNVWDRNYGVIRNGTFYIYENKPTRDEDNRARESYILEINLKNASVLDASDAKLGYSLEFISPELKTTKVVQFKNVQTRENWKEIINKVKEPAKKAPKVDKPKEKKKQDPGPQCSMQVVKETEKPSLSSSQNISNRKPGAEDRYFSRFGALPDKKYDPVSESEDEFSSSFGGIDDNHLELGNPVARTSRMRINEKEVPLLTMGDYDPYEDGVPEEETSCLDQDCYCTIL